MTKGVFAKIWRTFLAPRTTVVLIGTLSVFYFLGLIIPQKNIIPIEDFEAWRQKWPLVVKSFEFLKLTTIYSSPLVTALTILFFVNLVAVTSRRFPAVARQLKLPSDVKVLPLWVRNMTHAELVLSDVITIEKVKERLRSGKYAVIEGDDCFQAVKNNLSVIGSLFFHLSFLIILAGGLTLFHTRFWGEAFITEGQPFGGASAEYRQVVRWSELRKNLPTLAFTLEKIEPRFIKNEPVSLKSTISVPAGGTSSFDVNFPYGEGTTSVLVTDAGAAPLFHVVGPDGKERFGGFINLNIIRGDEDFFVVPDTGHEVRVKFWPDFAVDDNGYIYTKSFHFKNPLFDIVILKEGHEVARGRLRTPKDVIAFDGYRLSFVEIRYFGRFIVTDERGGGLLIIGFLLAIIGLIIRFGWQKREVYGVIERRVDSAVLLLGYRSEYYRGLNKPELDKLLESMRLK